MEINQSWISSFQCLISNIFLLKLDNALRRIWTEILLHVICFEIYIKLNNENLSLSTTHKKYQKTICVGKTNV